MHKLNDADDFEEMEYDPGVLAFSHEGFEIRNPYLSECGRFSVDPEITYGFILSHTGGGCMALIKDIGDNKSIWLTDDSGTAIPELEESGDALLGLFHGSQQIAIVTISDIHFEGDEPKKVAKTKNESLKAHQKSPVADDLAPGQ
jgi:hypothetical protein